MVKYMSEKVEKNLSHEVFSIFFRKQENVISRLELEVC